LVKFATKSDTLASLESLFFFMPFPNLLRDTAFFLV
jgi:hypothetical protein